MDTKPALLASALTAIGASFCCVAPLVLVSLGLGGAWLATLTQLEPLRPAFIALTLGLLAFAWHQLYRRAAVCIPGQACGEAAVLQRQRAVFWWVAIPLMLLLAFPWYASLFY